MENLVVTLEQFEQHLGKHLKQLALFALPRLYLDEDEDESEVNSNQAAAEYFEQNESEGSWNAALVLDDNDSGSRNVLASSQLCEAATQDDLIVVKSLIQNPEHQPTTEEVNIAAVAAASAGHVAILDHLLQHTGNMDASCLEAAAKNGQEDVVKMLVSRSNIKATSTAAVGHTNTGRPDVTQDTYLSGDHGDNPDPQADDLILPSAHRALAPSQGPQDVIEGQINDKSFETGDPGEVKEDTHPPTSENEDGNGLIPQLRTTPAGKVCENYVNTSKEYLSVHQRLVLSLV